MSLFTSGLMSEVMKVTLGNSLVVACVLASLSECICAASEDILSGAATNIEKYHKHMIDEVKQFCHPALKDTCRAAEQQINPWDGGPSLCALGRCSCGRILQSPSLP